MMRIQLTGFLEIFLCCIVGLQLFYIEGEMTSVDKITAVTNIFYFIALTLFVTLLTWFVFWRTRMIVKIKKTRDMLELLQILRIIRHKTAVGQRGGAYRKLRNMMSVQSFESLEHQATIKLDQCIQRTASTRDHLADILAKIYDKTIVARNVDSQFIEHTTELKELQHAFNKQRDSFKKYVIFFADKKITQMGLFESFLFVLRRTLFVLSVLFLVSDRLSLLAIGIYIFSSFLNLVYLVTVQPFFNGHRNTTEAVNEIFVLLTSYIALMLLDISKQRQELLAIGDFLQGCI